MFLLCVEMHVVHSLCFYVCFSKYFPTVVNEGFGIGNASIKVKHKREDENADITTEKNLGKMSSVL